MERLLADDSEWVAPILWRSEFRSVLRKYLRKNQLPIEDVLMIIQQAEKLMTDKEYEVTSAHIMQLVNSSNCSTYDCEFVALAQFLDVPLISADKKLYTEFPKITKSLDSYFT